MTNLEAYNEMVRDMVDINFVFDVAKMNKVEELTANINIDIKSNIENVASLGLVKVKVDKGRKWKGEGWLVGFFESSFCTGYREIYTKKVKIYDPSTNKIETIALNNVTITDISKLIEAYKKDIIDNIYRTDIDELGMSHIIESLPIILPYLSSLKVDLLQTIDDTLNKKKIHISSWSRSKDFMNDEFILENAIDEIEDAKKARKEEFKAKKMPELIEWVKNNTDKKGEEINKLAEHIFNKKYGN